MLKRKGIRISKTTCHKYMNKELNLHSIIVRKRPRYIKGERYKIFGNLLEREFEVNEKNKIWCINYNASTKAGQSGSPVLDVENIVCGIHTYGATSYNGGSRINALIYSFLCDKKEESLVLYE